jgi:hypothetical protein
MAEAAAAMQAAGSIISGISSYETGKYNRDVSNTMATEAERTGADQETRIRENARAVLGQQVAAQGADGFQMGTGSALDALAQTQVNAALDALTARREATTRARGLRIQGAQAYAAGKNALFQGLLGAASGAAKGSSDWASASAGMTGGMG